MSDPAFYDISATEATAAKIQEKTEVASAAASAKVRETAESTVRAARQLTDRLQDGWQQMSDCVNETRARIPVFKQELREDAAYIAERARYYHEERPIHTLGVIAAAAFVLGIAIGLGRR